VCNTPPETTGLPAKKEKFLAILNQLRVCFKLFNFNELKFFYSKNFINKYQPFLSDELLKERLEVETLESLKLIAKKETFNQKYIKIKTRLL